MSLTSLILRCVLVAFLLLHVGCSKPPTKHKVAFDGGSGRSGNLWVSGWNVFKETSRPSLLFCEYEIAGQPRQIGCFLVVKESPPAPGLTEANWTGRLSMTGPASKAITEISNGASNLSAEYSVTLQDDKASIKDSIRIGETDYDLGKGRVFQIDLTTTPVTVVQNEAPLPKTIESTSGVEVSANRTLEELKKVSPALAEFVEPAGKK